MRFIFREPTVMVFKIQILNMKQIEFILFQSKENVTVIVNSNTKQSRSFVEFKEWLDGAMSWYGNAEVGVRA